MSENQKTGKGLGIAALVCGISAAVAAFIPCGGVWAIPCGVVAIILGAISVVMAKKSGSPKGLGMAGLILGIVATIIAIIWLFVIGSKVGAVAGDLKDLEGALNELQDLRF